MTNTIGQAGGIALGLGMDFVHLIQAAGNGPAVNLGSVNLVWFHLGAFKSIRLLTEGKQRLDLLAGAVFLHAQGLARLIGASIVHMVIQCVQKAHITQNSLPAFG